MRGPSQPCEAFVTYDSYVIPTLSYRISFKKPLVSLVWPPSLLNDFLLPDTFPTPYHPNIHLFSLSLDPDSVV